MVAGALLGRYDWLKERLDEDGYIHGYYVDGHIVGDVIDSDDNGFQPEFWCPIDGSTLELVNNQPCLTIPKSVAKMVDEQNTTKLKFDDYDTEFFPYFEWSKKFDRQHGFFASNYLLDAYLAGKSLGVDLVKVVN